MAALLARGLLDYTRELIRTQETILMSSCMAGGEA
jgi:hypothetical protein